MHHFACFVSLLRPRTQYNRLFLCSAFCSNACPFPCLTWQAETASRTRVSSPSSSWGSSFFMTCRQETISCDLHEELNKGETGTCTVSWTCTQAKHSRVVVGADAKGPLGSWGHRSVLVRTRWENGVRHQTTKTRRGNGRARLHRCFFFVIAVQHYGSAVLNSVPIATSSLDSPLHFYVIDLGTDQAARGSRDRVAASINVALIPCTCLLGSCICVKLLSLYRSQHFFSCSYYLHVDFVEVQ